MRRVISVFLPTWPTDRLRRTDAGAPARDRPLVTIEQDRARRVLAAVDAAARSAGLRPGMTLAHAHARIAGLGVADADPSGDAAGLERLAVHAARHWSPIAAPDPPDGILIDATGCAHLFGGEAAMLARILARLKAAGIAAEAAIADTPGAAHAVARFGNPAPIRIVPPRRARDALAPLPIAALRIDREIAAEMSRFGFRRIGQLYGEPRGPLTLRFGPDLSRRLDQALGHAFEPITPVHPQDAPRCRMSLPEPLASPEALAFAMQRLTAELCALLETSGLGARRLDLLFERVDRSTVAIRIGTARPSRDPRHLARLLTDHLDEIDPGFGVEAMVLAASGAERLGARQIAAGDLTDDEASQPDLSELVDRLANLPQVARVFAATPVEAHVPERTVRHVEPLSGRAGAASWPAWPRPFWLLAPEPVQITALLPDDPPARFVWRGRQHRVRRADGPERIHLEWWRAPAEIRATRDYYRVEDEAGGRYWLFRDGRTNAGVRWFLHGVFA